MADKKDMIDKGKELNKNQKTRRNLLKGVAAGAAVSAFPAPWVRRVNASDKVLLVVLKLIHVNYKQYEVYLYPPIIT